MRWRSTRTISGRFRGLGAIFDQLEKPKHWPMRPIARGTEIRPHDKDVKAAIEAAGIARHRLSSSEAPGGPALKKAAHGQTVRGSRPSSARPTPARPITPSNGCWAIAPASSACRCGCWRARSMTGSSRARGPSVVALVTGEERIVPPRAAYWVCTVEAMPEGMGCDFVAVDEIQLCADPERGPCLHRPAAADARPARDAVPGRPTRCAARSRRWFPASSSCAASG